MRDPRGIRIRKLAVHVLDNTSDPPRAVLSDTESRLDAEITTFFASHIEKSLV